jgi:hypothetical protein
VRRRRLSVAVVIAATLLTLSVSLGASASSGNRPASSLPGPPLDRYSIVNGCYGLRLASGQQLGPFRMQATALGQYLLYGVHGEFLGPGLVTEATPSSSTVWRVDGHFTITNAGSGETLAVSLLPASGCAVYPEGQLDATGTPFIGASPEAQVRASSTTGSPRTSTTRAAGRRSTTGPRRPTWPRRATTTPGSSAPGWPGCA